MEREATIRPARREECAVLAQLAAPDRAGGFLLPLTAAEVAAHLHEFLVAEVGGEVVAMGRLKRFTDSLAEVRSLVVRPDHRRQELGRRLVRALLRRAAETGVRYCFALTDRTAFFDRLGFHPVHKEVLPVKIWADCAACPKRERCDEVAVWREVGPPQR
ncbi:MAG: GNAT family N-acetyltransferase [Nitrospirae bacterium]|nr:MAG: GNAT family N-acetyltransferase [Nitrospirota bacterium]